MRSKFPSLDLKGRNCSAVIIRPSTDLEGWLIRESRSHTSIRTDIRSVFPEEYSVWIIPSVATFESTPHLDEYLAAIKPSMSREELRMFGVPESRLSQISDVDLLALFLFELRDTVYFSDTLKAQ